MMKNNYFISADAAQLYAIEDYKGELKKLNLEEFGQVVKFLPVLSHGKATVERAFSSNKEVMVESLTQRLFIGGSTTYL